MTTTQSIWIVNKAYVYDVYIPKEENGNLDEYHPVAVRSRGSKKCLISVSPKNSDYEIALDGLWNPDAFKILNGLIFKEDSILDKKIPMLHSVKGNLGTINGYNLDLIIILCLENTAKNKDYETNLFWEIKGRRLRTSYKWRL